MKKRRIKVDKSSIKDYILNIRVKTVLRYQIEIKYSDLILKIFF